MATITNVEARAISVPLETTYHESEAAIDSFNHVIAEVHTEDRTGIGEADFLSLAQESAKSVAFAVNEQVAAAIEGMETFNVEGVLDRVHGITHRTLSTEATRGAMSCIDLALWDLQGKILHRPAYQLLGGRVVDDVPVSFTLSAEPPAEMAAAAEEMVEFGYRTLVVKVGRNDLETDEARVRQVRNAVGPDVTLRADVNGGYGDSAEAREAIRRFEPFDIEYVEQPLPRGNPGELRRLREAVDTPIVADESLVTVADAYRLAEFGAVDVFNIKPSKCGGLHMSSKIAAVAESAGVPCLVGGHPQQEITRQASRHFATARSAVDCGYANEGPGPASQDLGNHITETVVTYDDVDDFGGFVPVPEEAGLGVELDRAAVERYTTVGPCDRT